MARVVVTGAAGRLGSALVEVFATREDEILEVSRPRIDITVAADRAGIEAWRPEVIVNAAAWTDVDGCARDPALARWVNGHAAGSLAEVASRCGARFIQISTNEVFAGDADGPYGPDDPVQPRSAYGASKALGEELVAASGGSFTIIRTAWLFGPRGPNFVTKILAAAGRAVAASEPLRVVDDEWGNPTWIPSLAERIAALVGRTGPRIVHIAGSPATTRHRWADIALRAAGSTAQLEPIPGDAFRRASTPPRRAILSLTPEHALEWQAMTRRYVGELTPASSTRSDAMRAADPPSSAPTARSSAADRESR